ncbi:MAG: CcoQ/FixQ family Cbb3-type cytochrome c oxidase assembly chaperone [Pseudomonadales bacterium]|nr:CcoQ/FixQ family Cbb3-type cytochrome c oxidase assembly chaperone [Pseudomonadales bacterium]
MDIGTLKSIALLLAMGSFGLITWWAFTPRNKARFDEDAMLPFIDEKRPREKSL